MTEAYTAYSRVETVQSFSFYKTHSLIQFSLRLRILSGHGFVAFRVQSNANEN